jgi:hypothetical protein
MAENFFEKAGAFAGDAAIDTAADTEINRVIDGVAEHIPGGGMIDGMLKTGVDLQVNNAINARVGGLLGHHDAAPVAEAPPAEDAQASDDGTDQQS